MLRKYKQRNYDVAHTKQRFSIKKFKFGAASVLVGLAFLGMAGTTVLADETTSTGIEPKQSASAGIVDEVKPAKSELATDAIASVDKTTESEVEALADYTENVNTDVGGTVPESSANIDPNSSSKDTDKVAVLEETASEKNVIVSPAITTRSVDSAVEKANVDKNSVSEVSEKLQKRVQKDAIYSPGDSSAKQTYSGKAWIDNGGSIDGQASDDIPLAGVNVYLQWVNGKGYVSKVYYTTTLADGTFAFDLSKSEVDPNGEEHHFQLAGDGNFAVRTWIENPDSSKYDIIQAGDKIYGFHTRTNRKNESWDFTAGVNRIVNSQVILQEKKLTKDWLKKPEAESQIPSTADGTWHDRGIYGRVSGLAWFDNGDSAGTLANQWIKDGNDVPANGVKVAASYLNDEVTRLLDQWKKDHPGYTIEDFKAEQERVFTEYQAQHGVGSHIAETVITTVDKNGNYSIPFKGLYGVSAYKANSGLKVSHTITDEEFGKVVRDEDVDNSSLLKWNGTIGQKHRHINEDYLYVSPILSNYNIWSPAFPKAMFGNPNNLFTNVVAGSGTNITSLNFAILAPQPMLDIVDYDTTNKVAVSGNVTNSTVGGLLPTREYQVQWFRDGVAIGEPQTIQSSVEGTATPEKFTVPNDITKTTNFTLGLFEQGQNTKSLDNALALDSFIAVFIEYKPVDGVVAKDSEPAKPIFKDKDGNDTTPPEGTKFTTVAGQVPDSVKTSYPEGAMSVDPNMVTIDPTTGVVVVKGEALTKKGTYVVPVEVTYPGGSKAYTFATVNVKDDATTTYTATGGKLEKPFGQAPSTDEITSKVTTDYPKEVKDQPTMKVKEGAVIPDGMTKGEFKVPIVVTYPDGTTDEVDVTVTIKESEAEKNAPSYKDTMVVPGKPAESTPSYGEGKTAPNGTEYKIDENFKVPDGYKVDIDKATGTVTVTAPEKSDGTTAEEIEVPVIVTYPDKSEDKVIAKFQLDTDENGTPDVTDPDDDGDGIPDVDDKNPKTATKTAVAVDNVNVTEGQPIAPIPVTVTSDDRNAKVEVSGLPDGLTYDSATGQITGTPDKLADWKATEETRDFPATVKVTDGTGTVEKTFTITVQRDTDGDGMPDVTDTDDDGDGIPDDTEKIDGTNSKDPNSADSVITPLDDQTGTVGEAITPVTVKVDKVPTDGSVTVTGLPDGVTYDPATGQITGIPKKEGESTVTVAVLGKDGKPVMGVDGKPVTEEFKFTVKKLTDADKNEPKAKDQTVNIGETPKAEDSIENLKDLPDGTKVEFETPIDTTTAGDKPGKVVVTYPDGSTDTVDVTVKVVDPSTDADKNEPKAKDQTVNIGETPKAEDSIENLKDLPDGTKVEFETPIDTTTAGDKPGKVVVTYPDGSTDTVDVTVKVVDPSTDADKNEPKAKDQTVNIGETPKAEDSIENLKDLPDGTKVEFETPIDTTTAGDKPGKVVVTYPDGSTDTVDVTVKVVDPSTDADKNEPKAKDQTVNIGETPKAEDSIENLKDLPDGTKVEFETPIDTTTAGDKPGKVVVTYPDGSTDTVDVTVKVVDPSTDADKNEPKAKDQTVNIGETPKAEDSIENLKDLPDGTKVEFETPIDTTTAGDKPGKVVVTYPDGSTDTVDVTVKVVDPSTDADKNEPKAKDQTVNIGETPKAEDSIENLKDLPDGTKVEFETPIDTTTAGDKPGKVVVTYPDGSTDTVDVTVKVVDPSTDADKNEPKAKDQTVNIGETPKAEDSIENLKDLPDGTKVEFETPIDTTTAGDKPGKVVVTYPDGSTDTVDVTVKVVDPSTDADKNEPKAKDQTVNIGETPKAEDSIENLKDLPDGTKVEFETPIDTTTAGDKPGKVVVTYPDGSTDTVDVTVKVVDPSTDADKNEPKAKDQTVNIGETPKAEDSIENLKDLPDGTKVEFETPIDTTTAGDKPGKVVVTYPDGSTDTVDVTVKVVDPSTDADKNEPKAKDQTVNIGETPKAEDSIENLKDLPDGTKVEFETPIDTTTAGDKPGKVVVTYPDGSTDTVDVIVKVVDPSTDADKNEPKAKDQTQALSSIANNKDRGNKLPTTGEDENPFFNIAALTIIASVGLLSILKKKED